MVVYTLFFPGLETSIALQKALSFVSGIFVANGSTLTVGRNGCGSAV